MTTPLRINIFGPLEILAAQKHLKISSGKSRLILPVLLLLGQKVNKERLASLFWPDEDISDARHNLRQAIYRLKQDLSQAGLDPELIESGREEVSLLDSGNWSSDLQEINQALGAITGHHHAQGTLCETCVAQTQGLFNTCHGSLLTDQEPDSELLAELLDSKRAEYQGRILRLAQGLIDSLLSTGRFEAAATTCEQALQLFTDQHDSLVRRWAWALWSGGHKVEAIKKYQEFYSKSGRYPEDMTTRFFDELKQNGLTITTNLQFDHASHFTGREKELAEIIETVRTRERRLITIVAPGGSGKTTLAIQAGKLILHRLLLPVFQIPVPASQSAYAILTQVGQQLQLTFKNELPLETQLLEQLRASRAVIILDAAEHQLETAESFAAAMLANCPGITLIVTSREHFGVQHAKSYRLGLTQFISANPERQSEINILPLSQLEANRLYLNLLESGQPGFAINNQTAPLLADLCHQIAGIPLGIELLAGQSLVTSIEDVHTSLTAELHTAHDLTLTQRLQICLHWLHARLSPAEVNLLKALSYFPGGGTPAALQACLKIESAELQKTLALLQKRHLAYPLGNQRSDSHDYIKDYFSHEVKTGREKDIQAEVIHYYDDLVKSQAPRINTAAFAEIAALLNHEKDNLEQALGLAIDARQNDLANQMAAGLTQYWILSGNIWLGRALLDRVLAVPSDPRARVAAMFGRGNLANSFGELDSAQALFEEGLLLANQVHDNLHIMNNRRALAVIYARRHLYEKAELEINILIEDARQTGNSSFLANGLMHLANVLISKGSDDYGRIQSMMEESIAIMESNQEWVRVAAGLNNLGVILRKQGQYQQAVNAYQRSLALKESTGDRLGISSSLTNLGLVQALDGQDLASLISFERATGLLIDLQLPHSVPGLLGNTSRALMLRGDWPAAARVYGISERVYSDLGSKSQFDSSERQEWEQDLKTHLEPGVYSEQFNQGFNLAGIAGLQAARELLGQLLKE